MVIPVLCVSYGTLKEFLDPRDLPNVLSGLCPHVGYLLGESEPVCSPVKQPWTTRTFGPTLQYSVPDRRQVSHVGRRARGQESECVWVLPVSVPYKRVVYLKEMRRETGRSHLSFLVRTKIKFKPGLRKKLDSPNRKGPNK